MLQRCSTTAEKCRYDLQKRSTMNWDDLRIFLAVARAPRLTMAAKALDLDATTVSRRLGRLASTLGTTLFEPSPAGQSLTERGNSLLRYAEQMERAALTARNEIAGERSLLSGTVRVSVAEGFGTWIVARYLVDFHRANSGIVVELIASNGFLNPSKREADIAVLLARPARGPLLVRRLTDYRLCLYGAPAYLALHGAPASLSDLREHFLIGYVNDIDYSPALQFSAEIRPGTEPDIRSSSINAQVALTVSGAGLCVLPCFIGDRDERLVRVLPKLVLTRTFWVVVHKDVRQLARVAAFLDWLAALVEVEQQVFQG